MRERRAHEEAGVLRPLPLGELHRGHRRERLREADDALRLAGGAAGVGDRGDVVGRQQDRLERPRLELRGSGDQVLADVGQRVRHRADREDLLEAGALLQQAHGALGEDRVDHEDADLGVVDDVGVVVERAEGVQRGAAVALGLARAEDEQHLGTVEGQQRPGGAAAGVEGLEGLDVLADPGRGLAAREDRVAQVHHRPRAVPLQGGDHEVAVVGAGAQGALVLGLGRGHGGETRTCSSSGPAPRAGDGGSREGRALRRGGPPPGVPRRGCGG